jgi:hypothetical protein
VRLLCEDATSGVTSVEAAGADEAAKYLFTDRLPPQCNERTNEPTIRSNSIIPTSLLHIDIKLHLKDASLQALDITTVRLF